MADDPTRYLDVSGVLALKAGSTVDVDYTVTHANSVAARLGEVGARITDAAAESEARDDTLYEQVQQVRAVAEAGGGGMPDGGQPGQVLTTGSDGSAAWADPTGMPGRGITSIVASTTDPTTATVTYTDGSTAALTLPQGAEGRSIDSFGAPDPATGVSVVTFSDGSTTTITLPKGPQGDTGPAPTVSWAGDVLTVDGKASPPLTGPASTTPGPAPSIKIGTVTSGASPSATITGTSPDLTLGLVLPKGDPGAQGPPGVVSSASSYVIVGPGRPDAPTTTAGTITGAEPVGAEYRSTDGAQVGAWVWMKRPGNVWAATSGDTGWRRIGVSFINSGGLYIRRVDGLAYVSCGGGSVGTASFTGLSVGGSTGATSNPIPAGWRTLAAVVAPLTDDGRSTVGFVIFTSTSDSSVMQVRGATASSFAFGRVVTTPFVPHDPWPTAPLPGNPA